MLWLEETQSCWELIYGRRRLKAGLSGNKRDLNAVQDWPKTVCLSVCLCLLCVLLPSRQHIKETSLRTFQNSKTNIKVDFFLLIFSVKEKKTKKLWCVQICSVGGVGESRGKFMSKFLPEMCFSPVKQTLTEWAHESTQQRLLRVRVAVTLPPAVSSSLQTTHTCNYWATAKQNTVLNENL